MYVKAHSSFLWSFQMSKSVMFQIFFSIKKNNFNTHTNYMLPECWGIIAISMEMETRSGRRMDEQTHRQ